MLLEPVQAVHLLAVGQRHGRGLADRVPDLVGLRRPRRIEAEIVALALQRRHAGNAAIDCCDILRQQAGASGEFGGYPGKIARFALRLDRLCRSTTPM